MPSSIEIVEPSKFILTTREMTSFYTDLMIMLHKIDMIVKNVHAENMLLKQKSEKPKS